MSRIIKFTLYFFVLSLCIASALRSQPGHWSEPVNISNTDGRSDFPAMSIGFDGKIHIVWTDDSRIPGPNAYEDDILYTCYDGNSWSEPVMLSGHDTTYSACPRIAVDSFGKPHVVWQHNAIFYNSDVYYTTLTDTGWLEPLNLTPFSNTAYQPDIAIDSEDRIHVVWPDYYFGNVDILHMYCEDGIWSDFVNVSNDPIGSGTPRLVVDSEDHLHVAWRQLASTGIQCEVFYSFYDGENWTPRQNISQNPDFTSAWPSIAVDSDNNPHIAWYQWMGWPISEIFYSCFNGVDWTEPENITNQELDCKYPQLAINNQDEKFLLYMLSPDNDFSVNFSYCENSVWSQPEIMIPRYNSMLSDICIDSEGVLHAVISIIEFTCLSNIYYMSNESFNAIETKQDNEIEDFALHIYPNPFNHSSQITFNLIEQSEVELSIYNIQGRLIRTFINEMLPAGSYSENWNGTNLNGKEVSAGVYFVRLQVNEQSNVRKVLLIK